MYYLVLDDMRDWTRSYNQREHGPDFLGNIYQNEEWLILGGMEWNWS